MNNHIKYEDNILRFWRDNKIFEKSIYNRKNKKKFVFYEGPPTANAKPGIHHVLARALKDVICRYKTMRGFEVTRKAGWDTHGLPVELQIEKKLGLKNKKDIEKYGIVEFNRKCKESVWEYKKDWEKLTERIGYWLDMKDPYVTYEPEYIESVWWILKQIWQRGLLYQDYNVVPYCPRCGTSLASHEVAQGYKTIKENSIYLKLKIKGEKNTYLLVWTTTPWTLPGNVAVAINSGIKYVKAEIDSEKLILAKERLKVLNGEYKILEEINGKKLLGLEYESLYSFLKPDKKAHYIIDADFVSLEDGTGLVHMATAFGEEDMMVGKKYNLPILMTVDEEGKFKKEVKNWAGMFVKEVDPLIIKDLEKRKLLYKQEVYEHEYPFCWRCETPLLYYAKTSWFIKMTAVKDELVRNNRKINWIPEYLKEGRFGEWIQGVKDWNLSRERYWGTPLPVWKCEKCKKQICIGSIKELTQKSKEKIKIKDLHRPFIDKIILECECGEKMKRVPEVIDCWFDSGSMPFAQWHYPFENKKRIEGGISFPADFIAEGIDQTRGWFYTLLAISTLLDFGPCYKNVISHGIVLDAKGQKMSKSKGNVVWPKDVIEKFGADCARLYFYTINPVAEPKRFDFRDIQDLSRRIFGRLWNSYLFFFTYVEKGFKPKKNFKPKKALDRWVISRLNSLNEKIIENLDKYYVVEAARLFEDFIEDLSNWYIRRSRPRFQKPETQKIRNEASQTLYYVLLKLSQLIAPFAPFIADELYQKIGAEGESVHLSDYPKPDTKLIDKKVEEKMAKARDVVARALSERAEAGVRVRQPLEELRVKNQELRSEKELLELIKEEVNVKKIVFDNKIKKEIELDTKITKELEKEGRRRELLRNARDLRKKLGLTPEVIVSKIISTALEVVDKKFLKEAGAKKGERVDEEGEMEVDIKKEIKLKKGKKDYIGIKK